MPSLLLCLLVLQTPPALPAARAPAEPLVRSLDLDAAALLADSSLLAADTLVLALESRRGAFYKLSERGDILAAGKLLPGVNSLRFSRPGLMAASRSFFFVLDLLEDGSPAQKFLRVQVTAEGGPGAAAEKALSGTFQLEMYHSGRLFGFRKKSMTDLLTLTTGPVTPVTDPALSESAIRSQPKSSGIPVLGLAMALAKHLVNKRAEKRARARAVESQKRRLSMTITRGGREIPVTIELKAE